MRRESPGLLLAEQCKDRAAKAFKEGRALSCIEAGTREGIPDGRGGGCLDELCFQATALLWKCIGGWASGLFLDPCDPCAACRLKVAFHGDEAAKQFCNLCELNRAACAGPCKFKRCADVPSPRRHWLQSCTGFLKIGRPHEARKACSCVLEQDPENQKAGRALQKSRKWMNFGWVSAGTLPSRVPRLVKGGPGDELLCARAHARARGCVCVCVCVRLSVCALPSEASHRSAEFQLSNYPAALHDLHALLKQQPANSRTAKRQWCSRAFHSCT